MIINNRESYNQLYKEEKSSGGGGFKGRLCVLIPWRDKNQGENTINTNDWQRYKQIPYPSPCSEGSEDSFLQKELHDSGWENGSSTVPF